MTEQHLVERLLTAATRYREAFDYAKSFRLQLKTAGKGRCSEKRPYDMECNDPGVPPCEWSNEPEVEWCDYCRTKHQNLQPYREAVRQKAQALARMRRAIVALDAWKARKTNG